MLTVREVWLFPVGWVKHRRAYLNVEHTKYGTQMLITAYKPDSELFAVLAVIELNKDPVWFVLEDEINAKENRRIIKISFREVISYFLAQAFLCAWTGGENDHGRTKVTRPRDSSRQTPEFKFQDKPYVHHQPVF